MCSHIYKHEKKNATFRIASAMLLSCRFSLHVWQSCMERETFAFTAIYFIFRCRAHSVCLSKHSVSLVCVCFFSSLSRSFIPQESKYSCHVRIYQEEEGKCCHTIIIYIIYFVLSLTHSPSSTEHKLFALRFSVDFFAYYTICCCCYIHFFRSMQMSRNAAVSFFFFAHIFLWYRITVTHILLIFFVHSF